MDDLLGRRGLDAVADRGLRKAAEELQVYLLLSMPCRCPADALQKSRPTD